MNVKRQVLNRLSPILLLLVPTILFFARGWGAMQVNRAFVTLNHQPALFSDNQDGLILATVEAQLTAAQSHLGPTDSTQRMLAVVQQAQGQNAPVGMTVPDLWWWAAQKEKAGEWAAAAYLYQWATDIQPGLGDSWFYLGRAYETQHRTDEARAAYLIAAAAPTWHTFGSSDVYLALGNLTPMTETRVARAYYEQALELDQFGDAAAKAAAHYQLGEILLLHEANPVDALPHYQATLALTPDDHWAQLRMGYALYGATGDWPAAAAAIQNAIDTWPDEKYLSWPYFYLGDIYQDAGLITEAVAAYERVLQLDPAHASAQQRLTVLRSP